MDDDILIGPEMEARFCMNYYNNKDGSMNKYFGGDISVSYY